MNIINNVNELYTFCDNCSTLLDKPDDNLSLNKGKFWHNGMYLCKLCYDTWNLTKNNDIIGISNF